METQIPRSGVSGDVNYILMPRTITYALGVQALQTACAQDPNSQQPRLADGRVRPLSFKENIEARIKRYQSGGADRDELFNRWLDSCTGVAYKAGTSRMKIIPICTQLVEIAPDFRFAFLQANYDALDGIELDTADGTKYEKSLTRDEVLTHPAWLAAVEGDRELLAEYTGIIFQELSRRLNGQNVGMRFYIISGVTTDELRALFVSDLDDNSYANLWGTLNLNGSFARVSQAPQR